MRKTRVLIVDDDVALASILKQGLEKTGRYEVRTETSGRRAVAAAQAFRPDIVFLDVMMPTVDGGEVAARMHEEAQLKRIPIVFLTSLVSEEDARQGTMVSGGYPFLAKPVTVQQVVRCIEEQLATDG